MSSVCVPDCFLALPVSATTMGFMTGLKLARPESTWTLRLPASLFLSGESVSITSSIDNLASGIGN